MELVCDEQPEAFDEVVARYQHLVQRFALRMLGSDRMTAESLVIETFSRLWQNRRTYVEEGSMKAWLLRTCHRLILNHLGHEPPLDLLDSEVPAEECLEDEFEARTLAGEVQRCVLELSNPLRSVLILAVYEELDYRAISEILEIPMGTVASRRNQAVQILNRKLSSWNI